MSVALVINAQSSDSTQVAVPDSIQKEVKTEKPKKVKAIDSLAFAKIWAAKADKYLTQSPKRFDLAIAAYKTAIDSGLHTEATCYGLGSAYFENKQYSKALPIFRNISKKIDLQHRDAWFYLGWCYHLNYQFDSAIVSYEKYRSLFASDELMQKDELIKRHIAQANLAKQNVAKPTPFQIELLPISINTNQVEYAAIATSNDSLMVFTRRSANGMGKSMDQDGNYDEDLYISSKDSAGTWSEPKNIGKPINSSQHEASAGLTPDGRQLIVYKSSGGGDLFVSKFENDKWTSPKKLNKNINSSAHESSASFSYDQTEFYYSSDRLGGFGGHDIYKCKLDANGKWGTPERLPSNVNSAFDEVSMVALPDGKTYYFSSNGHQSMGGFDVFKITYQDSTWSEPENLGFPVNSPDDDILLSISFDMEHALLSTTRNDSSLHDIYQVTFSSVAKSPELDYAGNWIISEVKPLPFPSAEAPKEIKNINLTVLKGVITDKVSKEPVFANIELVDLATGAVLANFTSAETTGNYLISLPSGKDYAISVKAENFLFFSENITVGTSNGYVELVKNIELQKIEVGNKVVLKNVFFETGKSTLTKSSETELQNLINLLNNAPNVKIEISGHTDNVGNAAKNKTLSEQRAKAVVDYLVSKGIDSKRLTYKGYGFERPIAANTTKEGRQQNRRTEFEIISR